MHHECGSPFSPMWDEIQDMPGEIFDIDSTTGMPLFPGQDALSEEEIDEFFRESVS